MGTGASTAYSQEDLDGFSLRLYETALQQPCLLPDIGLDESLLKYSGLDSTAVLQAYSNDLVNKLPGYVQRVGSALAPLTSVPHAVGLGALAISLFIEIAIGSGSQTRENTYSMLQRVFGEEKASSVRDTMSEYLRRHSMFLNNGRQLQVEIQRLEAQLSNHLTVLRNSLLHDGQMSSRGFKIWVNGASFHLQMLIHNARLQTHFKPASQSVNEIEATTNLYLSDLDEMLEKYKTFKISNMHFQYKMMICASYYHSPPSCTPAECIIGNGETKCYIDFRYYHQLCGKTGPIKTFLDLVYTKYEPISELKSHFINIKQNLKSLINQHGSFTLTQRALQ